MTNTEYKDIFKSSKKSVEEWIVLIDISLSTHKSYSCGRRTITSKKARRIKVVSNELHKTD